MRRLALAAAALAAAVVFVPASTVPARAESGGVVAVVNDKPITGRDITQRIALLKVLGDGSPEDLTPRGALKTLIDDEVKMAEATRLKLVPDDAEIDRRIEGIAKGTGGSRADLLAKLKKAGVSERAFRAYVTMLIAFNQIVSMRYRDDVKVTDADIDARMASLKGQVDGRLAEIRKDPRMKPVTVYSIMPIDLPLDGDDPMLLQGRAVEAQQILSRFKGCKSVRSATSGIFNVKVGKAVDADISRLPAQLRQALDKAGPGKAIGPIRGKTSIQLLAYCGSRKITPKMPDFKMPTRDQVRRLVINEKYDSIEEEFLKTIRGKVYVEYRDPKYAP
jgi:peptidyl-prolyl cis-trans isomerase SurA